MTLTSLSACMNVMYVYMNVCTIHTSFDLPPWPPVMVRMYIRISYVQYIQGDFQN